jgi:hypothetical protein
MPCLTTDSVITVDEPRPVGLAGGRVGALAPGRFALLAALALTMVVLVAAPASAHTASGPRPTNYLTSIGSISPRIPGVTVRVVELGNKLQLTNRSPADVVVLGYDGEPYLRVGPRGLYENLRSQAVYLNRTRAGSGALPAIAEHSVPSMPPLWHRVSGSHTAIWHDHRIHWMGAAPPPVVQRAPGERHTVDPRWTVEFRAGAQTVVVRGRLDWVPGPSWLPWLPIVGGLFALGFVLARRRGPAAIVAVVALVGVDLAHTISAEAARAGAQTSKTLQFFGDNFVSVIVWIAAGTTIWSVARRRVDASYGVLFVGVMIALVSGVTDASYLWKSQLPTVGPDVGSRAEVAIALGLGLGLAAGALLVLRRSAPSLRTREVRDPRWLERLVAGLDHDAIAVECSRMDAGEVIPLALTEVARRLAPVAAELGPDALVFVVLAEDEIGTHVWSVTAGALGSSGLRVQRGRPAPARAELRFTFPAFAGVLGGAIAVGDAVTAGRLDVDGDPAFVAAVEPLLDGREGRYETAARGQ